MARTLTVAAQAILMKQYGTEPINIIEIVWVDGTSYFYADKDILDPNGNIVIPGRILSLSDIIETLKITSGTPSQQLSVELDDSDGSIKTLMNTIDIHKRPCKLYQTFEGLELTEKFLLYEGLINSPIVWNEGDRSVSFEIISNIVSFEAGFAPEEGQFANISPSLIGKPWPLCFGEVIHVPAVKSVETTVGTTTTAVGIPDYTLPLKEQLLQLRLRQYINSYDYYMSIIERVLDYAREPVLIENDRLYEIIKEGFLKQQHEDIIPILKVINDAVQDLQDLGVTLEGSTPKDPCSYCNGDEDPNEPKEYPVINFEYYYIKVDDKFYKIELGDSFYPPNRSQNQGEGEPPNPEDNSNLPENEVVFLPQDLFTNGGGSPSNGDVVYYYDENRWKINYVEPEEGAGNEVLNDLFSYLNNQDTSEFPDSIDGGDLDETLKKLELFKDIQTALLTISKQLRIWALKNKNSQKLLSVEGQNAEYKFKTIGSMITKLKKLYTNYHRDLKSLYSVAREIDNQSQLMMNQVVIINGEKFPQGVVTRIKINGMVLEGVFNGKLFTIYQHLPEYMNIPVGYREDQSDPTSFWIATNQIDLSGHYCLLRNGKIIKVSDQNQRRCTVELVEKQKRIRRRKYQSSEYKTEPELLNATQTILTDQKVQQYTAEQKRRIYEDAIDDADVKQQLDHLKENIKKISDKIDEFKEQGAIDDVRTLCAAIWNDMSEYNQILTGVRIPMTVVDKVEKQLSDEDFNALLRLEQLTIKEYRRSLDKFVKKAIPFIANPEPKEYLEEDSYGEDEDASFDFFDDSDEYYVTGFDADSGILAASRTMLPEWLKYVPQTQQLLTLFDEPEIQLDDTFSIDGFPPSTLWIAQPGSAVTLYPDSGEKYIANILPSTVHAVYAYRGIQGSRKLVPVPSSYYSVNENDLYVSAHQYNDIQYRDFITTSIILYKPLSHYANEDWEDEIFVTLKSSVGPNTVDIITYLVQAYTNLLIDSESFNHVKSCLENYPQSFALSTKKDAMQLIEEIAWQSRCMVYVRNGTIYIKYLSETPIPRATITEDDIDQKTLKLTLTSSEDIVTKFTANWDIDYAIGKRVKSIFRYNINKYGVQAREFDFYTYNIQSLVEKSATFWMIRKANTWKLVEFKTYLTHLDLQTWDAITLSFGSNYIANDPVIGLIQDVKYNSSDNTVWIQCWLPIRSGEMTTYNFAFPADLEEQTIWPTVEDIAAGNAGNPNNVYIPTGSPYNSNPEIPLTENIELRPKDYGDLYPSDNSNSMPASVLTGYTQLDYAKTTAKGVFVNPEDSIYTKEYVTGKVVAEIKEEEEVNTEPFNGVITSVSIEEGESQQEQYLVTSNDGREVTAIALENINKDRLVAGSPVRVVYSEFYKKWIIEVQIYKTKVKLITVADDYLVVTSNLKWDPENPETEPYPQFIVAKPFALRRTPFDMKTNGDNYYLYKSAIERSIVTEDVINRLEGKNCTGEDLPPEDPDDPTTKHITFTITTDNSDCDFVLLASEIIDTEKIGPEYKQGDLLFIDYIEGNAHVVIKKAIIHGLDSNNDARRWISSADANKGKWFFGIIDSSSSEGNAKLFAVNRYESKKWLALTKDPEEQINAIKSNDNKAFYCGELVGVRSVAGEWYVEKIWNTPLLSLMDKEKVGVRLVDPDGDPSDFVINFDHAKELLDTWSEVIQTVTSNYFTVTHNTITIKTIGITSMLSEEDGDYFDMAMHGNFDKDKAGMVLLFDLEDFAGMNTEIPDDTEDEDLEFPEPSDVAPITYVGVYDVRMLTPVLFEALQFIQVREYGYQTISGMGAWGWTIDENYDTSEWYDDFSWVANIEISMGYPTDYDYGTRELPIYKYNPEYDLTIPFTFLLANGAIPPDDFKVYPFKPDEDRLNGITFEGNSEDLDYMYLPQFNGVSINNSNMYFRYRCRCEQVYECPEGWYDSIYYDDDYLIGRYVEEIAYYYATYNGYVWDYRSTVGIYYFVTFEDNPNIQEFTQPVEE